MVIQEDQLTLVQVLLVLIQLEVKAPALEVLATIALNRILQEVVLITAEVAQAPEAILLVKVHQDVLMTIAVVHLAAVILLTIVDLPAVALPVVVALVLVVAVLLVVEVLVPVAVEDK